MPTVQSWFFSSVFSKTGSHVCWLTGLVGIILLSLFSARSAEAQSMTKVSGVGWVGDGAGMTVTNMDSNARPEFLFMAYDDLYQASNSFRP
jgi:hypothetical protein